MRIIFCGQGERGQRCLDYLIKYGYKPILLVGEFEKTNDLPVFRLGNINSSRSITKLKKLKPDLIILANFIQILKQPVIDIPKKGVINLHGGKLPEYRGASVLNWQIINGEKEIGISIIIVDQGIDTGDIISQKRWLLKSTDTINNVVRLTLKYFPPMLLKAVKQIEAGTIKRTRQDLSKGKLYRKRRPEDGLINWRNWRAVQVINFVRALTKPYPGAFTDINGVKTIIWKAKVLSKKISSRPGMVVTTIVGKPAIRAKDKVVLLTSFEYTNS